jgi:pimeloyl-ACP methyl ester carboxylesterase
MARVQRAGWAQTTVLAALVCIAILATGCATIKPLVPPQSEAIPGVIEGVEYYLISFDRDGCEIPAENGEYLSDRVAGRIAANGGEHLDVMIVCHGWQYDFARARGEYFKWLAESFLNKDVLDRLTAGRPERRAIVIGLHWPSASRLRLSFWYMRGRARLVGEVGGHLTLLKLQKAVKPQADVRFHLMGHSLGAVVVSEMLLGPPGAGDQAEPVDSLLLVEAAIPLWSFCSRIPEPRRPYKNMEHDSGPGWYWHIVRDGLVKGPIVNVYSKHDSVLRKWFEFANSNRGAQLKQFRDPPPYGEGPNPRATEYPTFGAAGAYGLHGPLPCLFELQMLRSGERYELHDGCVHNVDGSRYISNHMDFVNPAVWNLLFQVFALN